MDTNNIPALLLLTLGTFLFWCGFTNRSPVKTAQAMLTGRSIPPRGTVTGATTSPSTGSGTTPSPMPGPPSQVPAQPTPTPAPMPVPTVFGV